MGSWMVFDLKENPGQGILAGGHLPPDDPAYSTLIDVAFSRRLDGWAESSSSDAGWREYAESEAYYVVVRGRLDLEVDGERVSVPSWHLLGLRAGTPRRIVGGEGPVESFVVRVPGRPDGLADAWFLLDLRRAPPLSYQAGACLPLDDPAYSPVWDFWSGWQRNRPTWHGQDLHTHSRAEEYYVVLQGRLDLRVDEEIVPMGPGTLVIVKPGTVHGVVGVQDPVNCLFFRVPGGRGDKVPIGPNGLG